MGLIPFQTLRKSNHDGPVKPSCEVIRTSDELKNFYDLLDYENPHRDIIIPPVNFDTEMVLAVARGECPTEGYSVEIEEIIEHEGKLIAMIYEINSEEGIQTACSYPYHAVKTARYDGEIEFRKNGKLKSETENK